MAEKVVDGEVRVSGGTGTVKLTGREPGLPPGLTFRVTGKDSLRWIFTNVPAHSKASVRFFDFRPKPDVPPAGVPYLLTDVRKDSAEAVADRPTEVEGGNVRDDSAQGTYFYKVFLVHPTGPDTELRCVGWSGVEWGGGDKSGKPKGVGD